MHASQTFDCAEDPPQSASEHPTKKFISLRPMCRTTTSSTSWAGTGAGRRRSSSRRSSRKKQCARPQHARQARSNSAHHPTFESAAHKSRISEDTTNDDVSDSNSTRKRHASHGHLESLPLRSVSTAAAVMTSSNRESNAMRGIGRHKTNPVRSFMFLPCHKIPQANTQNHDLTHKVFWMCLFL